MARPHFTPEEAYLIGFYQSKHGLGDFMVVESAMLFAFATLVTTGYLYQEGVLVVIGFLLYFAYKARELIRQRSYSRTMASILGKYESEMDSAA